MPLSHSKFLNWIATASGTIFLGFGINALFRPRSALEMFEWSPPTLAADQKLVDNLMVIYGARDVFMGLAIYFAAFYGTRKSLGWTLIAASGVAFVDGLASISQIGGGQWNHWGYAPVITLVGSLLLGVLD
eukprot:TRINITY_DN14353_c0_g1_i1.p1 TRINITY_DN14353_c0_g1~~TRINITY_DN14353_c0_g1_i1.p1  ORF type:complete len:131 (-),score=39.29 TRINITY_DN14353_c0_g1_i1:104-496(-)